MVSGDKERERGGVMFIFSYIHSLIIRITMVKGATGLIYSPILDIGYTERETQYLSLNDSSLFSAPEVYIEVILKWPPSLQLLDSHKFSQLVQLSSVLFHGSSQLLVEC